MTTASRSSATTSTRRRARPSGCAVCATPVQPCSPATTRKKSRPAAYIRPMATIEWFEGDRDELQELFELADDSQPALAEYRDKGRVLVARDDAGAAVGHLQLIDAEIKNFAVRE